MSYFLGTAVLVLALAVCSLISDIARNFIGGVICTITMMSALFVGALCYTSTSTQTGKFRVGDTWHSHVGVKVEPVTSVKVTPIRLITTFLGSYLDKKGGPFAGTTYRFSGHIDFPRGMVSKEQIDEFLKKHPPLSCNK